MSKNKVTEIARKWYVKIGFPEKFDAMFNALLEEENPESVPFEKYNASENSKGKTFIMYLYFCEQLAEKYKEAGISEKILMATLSDFIINTEREYILSGELGLVKPSVLKNHLSMRLFRIGRLQFCMDGAARDISEKGIIKGENVIDVHIPAGGSLLRRQKSFLQNIFPNMITAITPVFPGCWTKIWKVF